MLRVGEDRAVKRGYDVINHLNFMKVMQKNYHLMMIHSMHIR